MQKDRTEDSVVTRLSEMCLEQAFILPNLALENRGTSQIQRNDQRDLL